VETLEQLGFLAEEGCDAVQGYLLGKPAPIGQYAALVGGTSNVMEPVRKTG
jgi:EAL domain-containing protein (putative c-di-GMP-specific phosphodiesterase class I)